MDLRQLEITPQELSDLLRAGAPVQLVDVRQPWENAVAALPGSQLIPLDQLEVRADEVVPQTGVPLVCYCHHGVRSLHATAFLLRRGLSVRSLAGGIDRWSQEIDPAVPRY